MKPTSKLRRVLSLAVIREKKLMFEYSQLQQELNKHKKHIDDLNQYISGYAVAETEYNNRVMTNITITRDFISHIQSTIQTQKNIVVSYSLVIEKKHAEWLEASRNRQLIEKICENREDEASVLNALREQKLIDDLVAVRRPR